MTHRNKAIDSWKGIAILAVIAIHSTGEAFGFPQNSGNHYFGLILRQILNFAVPLFFGIAGYLSPSQSELAKEGSGRYVIARLRRLWIPYLTWTIITVAILRPAALLNPGSILTAVLVGKGISIGYFVIVLSCMILVHPFTSRYRRGFVAWLITILPTLVSVLASYYVRIYEPSSRGANFTYYALPFTIWFGFFHFGFMLKQDQTKSLIKELTTQRTIAILGCALLMVLAEAWLLSTSGYTQLAASQIKVSSYISSAIVILAVFRSPIGEFSSGFLAWLGSRSFVFYLSHLLVLRPVAYQFSRSASLHNVQVLYVPLLTAVTVVALSVGVIAMEKILPKAVAGFLGVKS